MAVSATESPTTPDAPVPGQVQDNGAGPRASDAERDEAASRLGEHFAAGRLSHATFMHRMNMAMRARRRSDLPPLFADLPPRERPRGRLTAGWLSAGRLTAGLRGIRAREPAPPSLLRFPRGGGTSFTIGRDRECDMMINDITASRVHARLERIAEGWLLTDLGSTNGTRLNGWRIHEAVRVRAGDVVCFGQAEYALGDPVP
ncbi:MAG: DUF1707 domain-containing protein [Nocardiopsaceae bacterium]|nr:DUF1707 domain-containing protein [Nocardiopsaceae bacterium]